MRGHLNPDVALLAQVDQRDPFAGTARAAGDFPQSQCTGIERAVLEVGQQALELRPRSGRVRDALTEVGSRYGSGCSVQPACRATASAFSSCCWAGERPSCPDRSFETRRYPRKTRSVGSTKTDYPPPTSVGNARLRRRCCPRAGTTCQHEAWLNHRLLRSTTTHSLSPRLLDLARGGGASIFMLTRRRHSTTGACPT